MKTECKTEPIKFEALGKREIVANFNGGSITSDGGALLLRELDNGTAIFKRFTECFTDYRDPRRIEHDVFSLVSQRVLGLVLGYEDICDHDELSKDQMLAVAVGKTDPAGKERKFQRDKGRPLAGKSTLNRLELSPQGNLKNNAYKKIGLNEKEVDKLLVDIFLESEITPPKQIILDVDATDNPLHGNQEGRFFHGYYKAYCYLPLYIFCGDHLLCARLREANNDAAEGTVEELMFIVERIRSKWPDTQIVVRCDSGFCRENLMCWCEDHDVDYVIGAAKNDRLKSEIEEELALAKALYQCSGKSSRVFKDFCYSTLKTWRWQRRVIGKAEYLEKGENPRFIVTSLNKDQYEAQELYEKMYCARGDMENRIKEQQLMLFASRTSTSKLRSNQIRLYFSSIAYTILQSLRRLCLAGTEMARAQCDTIRLKILKIGARIQITVRRVWIMLATGYPYKELWGHILTRLNCLPLRV